MAKYTLYVKTHNVTGLKYLGKTEQDAFKYKGSGTYWKRHLNVHGNDVKTEILGAYTYKEDLIKAAIWFSEFYNIVESEQWANLMPETGEGGGIKNGRRVTEENKEKIRLANIGRRPNLGKKFSQEHIAKIKLANTGKKASPETLIKLRNSHLGYKPSEETRRKLREAQERRRNGKKN